MSAALWQPMTLSRIDREKNKGQVAHVFWFTGLSGSGKSTLANRLEQHLNGLGRHTYLLDGDNVRHGLNKDLGFSAGDRAENIRRVAEVARLMVDAGLVVLVAFISPFAAERAFARSLFAPGDFYEVHVQTPLACCEARDIKGMYAKARRGEIKDFTGISSPYEEPLDPELRLDTSTLGIDACIESILALRITSRVENDDV